ncbi:hypothetical protein THRCLA_21937, partial [Thraustotheca clavata]
SFIAIRDEGTSKTRHLFGSFKVFVQIPKITVLHPAPPQCQLPELQFYGGSFICGHDRPLLFVQESFAFNDVCSIQLPLAYNWKPMNSLFAVAVGNISTSNELFQPSDFLCHENVKSTLAAAKLYLQHSSHCHHCLSTF